MAGVKTLNAKHTLAPSPPYPAYSSPTSSDLPLPCQLHPSSIIEAITWVSRPASLLPLHTHILLALSLRCKSPITFHPQILPITLVPVPILCLPEWSLLLPLPPEVSFQPKCRIRACHCSVQNPGRAPCFIRVKARDLKNSLPVPG